MTDQATVRLTIVENGKHNNRKPVVVKRGDFKAFLKVAQNKLRIKAKRAFTKDGEEIVDLLDAQKLPDDSIVVVSAGDNFVGYVKDEEQRQKEKYDPVVGLHERNKEKEVQQVETVIRIIAHKSYIEAEAIKQLHATAALPNMRLVVGLPDLHPGKGFPIGSASVSEDVIYPHLVGADIGCGMCLWKTSVKAKKAESQVDKWVDALNGLEQGWSGDIASWLQSFNAPQTSHDATSLGTIGGGNHFAELQQVECIYDQEEFDKLGLDSEYLYLLVHSGSRGYGEEILKQHIDTFGHKGLLADSEDARKYLELHDSAMRWAKANRALIAHKFMECITLQPISRANCHDDVEVTSDGTTMCFDVWHNCVVQKEFSLPIKPLEETNGEANPSQQETKTLWLHRKGAAPADVGPVVIPGSRGHFSYLIVPINSEVSGYSLAHGAGRKWNRGKALQMASANKKLAQQLTITELGSRVICENKDLLFEEVPQAYKEIDDIINDLKHFNLIKVVATFRPIITYKTRVIKYSK